MCMPVHKATLYKRYVLGNAYVCTCTIYIKVSATPDKAVV
jgi:hypothetical protein